MVAAIRMSTDVHNITRDVAGEVIGYIKEHGRANATNETSAAADKVVQLESQIGINPIAQSVQKVGSVLASIIGKEGELKNASNDPKHTHHVADIHSQASKPPPDRSH